MAAAKRHRAVYTFGENETRSGRVRDGIADQDGADRRRDDDVEGRVRTVSAVEPFDTWQ